ncbi:MAG: hypothetical protein JXA10_13140 [Anaerolineae bacterium]|nr:hypothetical protein [Anaerolineae bacterium]
MSEILFACMPANAQQALVLIRSLRTFGGSLAQSPIWLMVPRGEQLFSHDDQAALTPQGVLVVPCDVDADARQFPFAAKVFAAALVESLAQTYQIKHLIWLDSDVLFIQEPGDLLIPAEKHLGYCPVHHRLIGSRIDKPLDAFWSLVYETCAVPPDHVFSMRTIVGDEAIRPYINAGFMATKPADGLLQAWCDQFAALFLDERFTAFYEQHVLYRIFVHQAILTGVVMAKFAPADLIELPRRYNYPLHLYADHAPEKRPPSINDLITCRYENVFAEAGWPDRFPITGDLKTWLENQFRG